MKAKAYIVHRAMCEPELEWSKPKDCLSADPLYTTPPQRTWVGLTDEEVNDLYNEGMGINATIEATEAKLKDKNNG